MSSLFGHEVIRRAMTENARLRSQLADLITAFHILHQQGVLDEYGHVSIRSSFDPNTFFISNTPPLLVSSEDDIKCYNIGDGSPVDKQQRLSPWSEHYIHSSIYARYPDTQAVVHSHSPAVVPFSLSDGLKAVTHVAGFLGEDVPNFNTKDLRGTPAEPEHENLLINTKLIADELAKGMGDHKVILQSGHGFVTSAGSLQDAVYQAVFTHRNAQIQATAMVVRAAGTGRASAIMCLNAKEADDCAKTINSGMPKTWPAWSAQVERSGMYINKLKQ